MNKSSLVILGNGTQGLGIVRSAGKSGIPIIQINDKYISAARFSKFITKYIKLTSNLLSKVNFEKNAAEELVKVLLELPVTHPSILLGTNEDINEFICSYKVKLSEKYFIPDNEYETIFDKYSFNQFLPEENKIETYLYSEDILRKVDSLGFVLKGRKGNKFKVVTGKKAIYLKDSQNESFLNIQNSIGIENLIIQKVVDGNFPVQSVCAFSVKGDIKGLFIYEKLRQHPDKFGTGTYLRSIENSEVLNIAKIILSKLEYTGISEIEFILDPLDNKFKVIEMNPRTWKSINFASQCGQNIIQKYIDFVINNKVEKDNNYMTEQYWTDIFADISQMIREKKLYSYNFNNLYECTWEKRDPLPFIASIFLLPFIAFKF